MESLFLCINSGLVHTVLIHRGENMIIIDIGMVIYNTEIQMPVLLMQQPPGCSVLQKP